MDSKLGSVVHGRKLTMCGSNDRVVDVAKLLTKERIGAVAVVDGGRLVGIFTERDLLNRIVSAEKDPCQVLVREVMTQNPVTAKTDEEYFDALEKMQKHHCRHLPIVDDGVPVGMVSLRDLLFIQVQDKDTEIRRLNEFFEYLPPDSGFGG